MWILPIHRVLYITPVHGVYASQSVRWGNGRWDPTFRPGTAACVGNHRMSRLLHIVLFGAAVAGCAIAVWRGRTITHSETRAGLIGLSLSSGVWATAQLITFFDVSLAAVTAIYQIGLVAGFATVGAWLYFCSAYTGHEYHRDPTYRYAALAIFVPIATLKLTNPIHGQYYSIEIATTPFRHASTTLLELHWVVTILAYSLTAVGFYMLFQTFVQSDIETDLLTLLVGLTALPIALNVFSVLGTSWLVSASYEPIGVAAFAVGVLYIASDTFEEVRWISHQQLLDNIDEAVLIIDDTGQIRTFNAAAETLFEGVSAGDEISALLPATATFPDRTDDEPVTENTATITVQMDGGLRYYQISETPYVLGPSRDGRALVISDVTTLERKRREVQRQSEQLEGLAAAIAHELRNTLGTANGNLRLARELIGTSSDDEVIEMVERANEATDRGFDVVEKLLTATRLSLAVTETVGLPFEATVREGFSLAQTEGVSLVIENGGEIQAERTRWVELVKNVAELAAVMNAAELTVERTADGIRFRTDTGSLPADGTGQLFEYGTPVPNAKAGLLGPSIRTLTYAHGWELSATSLDPEGIEIRITWVTKE